MTTLIGKLASDRARELVGIPFAHCGRTESGLDCVGVILMAYSAAGVEIGDFRGYSRQAALNDPKAMLKPILEHFRPVPWAFLAQGDVLLFSIQGVMTHVGIYVGGDLFVHAYEGSLQKVIIDRLTTPWRRRLKGVYKLK